MKRIITMMFAVLMLIPLLAGCTGGSSEDSTADTKTTKETSEYPKTIVDASGREIVLESAPEKIALLHTFYLEHFFALGVNPIAASMGNLLGQEESLESSELFGPYMKGIDIMDLGSSTDLNLEAILEAEPDVIITFSIHKGVEEIYDQLTQIAPVILLDYKDTWQDQLRSCAEIVGKEKSAETVITEIEQKISEAKTAASKHTDKTFSLFRTDGKGFITLGSDSYFETFGLTKPEGYPAEHENISLETLAQIDPYYIVFQHNYKAAQSFIESMKDSSVWNSLDAVKNNRVYFFDENMNTFGPLAMKLTAEKVIEIYSE